ncbi:hypothetical protein PVAP13_2NG543900 [Panicum virgatum]|uniref:Cysteine-rich transmembrane domain-containing protein n=1 Tax=Panicum virgatum TaxID=38727 RepID=A0A8T0VZJ1_PANVG|nr:hypothetical protein PVAP13_2NG543900 [Panicum virgatum]
MSYYGQQQAPVTAYPPTGGYAATAPPLPAGQPYVQPPPMQAGYVQPAPPAGYPGNFTGAMMNPPPPQEVAPAQTQSRGDKAFWEGCCAALCCCCILDMCC